MKEKIIALAEKLNLLNQKQDAKSLAERAKFERQRALEQARKDPDDTSYFQNRPQKSSTHVKTKFGATKSGSKEYLYTEHEKYYKMLFGLVRTRHWRVETFYGIPVRYLLFGYLISTFAITYTIVYFSNRPWRIDDDAIATQNQLFFKRYAQKIIHVRYVLDRLNECQKIRDVFGNIEDAGVSKLHPADHANFRAKYVTEVWAKSELS